MKKVVNDPAPGDGLDFGTFWDAYALKRSRRKAELAWDRLSRRDRRAALAGIAAYREACLRSGVSMMYAQGYLNNRRWEDEEVTPSPPPRCGGSAGGGGRESRTDEMELW